MKNRKFLAFDNKLDKDGKCVTGYIKLLKKNKISWTKFFYFSKVYKLKNEKEVIMKKYVCLACGYTYDPADGDPDTGIEPGTAFEDLPDDWVCPVCGVGKDMFEEVEED